MTSLSKKSHHPLMSNNIDRNDRDILISFLKKNPRLTASKKVLEFEKKWSKWLGTKYSIFVNSGSSANFITIRALKIYLGNNKKSEIITPPLAWNSDVVSVLENSYKPIFCDVRLSNLAMDKNEIKKKLNKKTAAVFLSHIQGFNGLDDQLIKMLKKNKIYLIEDVCESHGAKYKNKKCGTFGLASNFSFYYAHHMTTIEGGMISTNNKKFYDLCCMLRAHGLVRESKFKATRNFYKKKFKNLNEEFIFFENGFNMRSTEINAVLGINQLKKLDRNIKLRNRNFKFFINNIDKKKYFTNFDLSGISNYAFPIFLNNANIKKRDKFEKVLKRNFIEFRRGNAGGGNQLRQPYLRKILKGKKIILKNTDYIHNYGYYIGNYPELKLSKIKKICEILNSIN